MDDPDVRPACSAEETEYLCAAANRYANRPVAPADVVATWSGVRPLFDDGRGNVSSVTRDYVLHVDDAGAPLVSVFGGKITTYRKLAEAVLERLAPALGARREWTGREPLPGGDFGGATFAELHAAYVARYPRLAAQWLERLLRRHGTNSAAILGDARTEADLGRSFGGGLFEREVRYLADHEWATAAEDVLWRRTKFGLRTSPAEQAALAEHLGSQR